MSCDHLDLSSSYEKATIVFWSKNLISIKMFIATNFCRLPASYGAPTSSLRPLYPLSTILLQVSLSQLFFRLSSGVHRRATLGRAEGGIRSAWLISFPRVKCNREFCFFLSFSDGVFAIKPPGQHEVKTYCDFTTEGGPWTLLVSSKTHSGWDKDSIKERNSNKPSLQDDYSILGLADAIKDFDKAQVNPSQWDEFDFLRIEGWFSRTRSVYLSKENKWWCFPTNWCPYEIIRLLSPSWANVPFELIYGF